jgi:integrase
MSYLVWQRALDVRMSLETQITDSAIRFKPSKTAGTGGKVLDVEITPQIRAVINRAKSIKKKYLITSPYLFPIQKGGAYSKTGLHSMWRRAKERGSVTDDVQFKDLRVLGATDAAKAEVDRSAIQTRLAHTTGKTTEIYIKEAIPERSSLDIKLPR